MTPEEFRDLSSLRDNLTPRACRVLDHLLDHPHTSLHAHTHYTNRFDGLPQVERDAITYFLEIAASYKWRPAIEVYSRLEEHAWTPRADSRAQWEMTR